MALNVELLRGSFEIATMASPQFVSRSYDILFERYPQAKPMFASGNQARQTEMLNAALVAVLDHLEDEPWLAGSLGALGAKHVEYGVTPEMYNWVGEAWIAAIAEGAGPAWTPEMNAAWVEAYGVIVSLMLAPAS
jgi:hemoglobin-like flavoprotein